MKSITSASLAMAIVSISFVGALGAGAEARSPSESSPSKTVTGEVSIVEGEFHMTKDSLGKDKLDIVDKSYVITNQAGGEVRLELNRDTKIRNRVNPGDTIEAKISSDGQTLSVIRLVP